MGLVVFSLRSLVFLCILRFRIFKVRIFTLKSRGWGMKAHCYDRHPNGARHRSPMKSTVKKRINLQVSQQQLQIHTGSTANFLTREDSSRDLLGKFHKDRSVWIRARRRVLQCLSYQFPCALQLKQWSILNELKCRLCEKYYTARNIPEPPDTVESVGHIQCYCLALQLPRIAIHHGI